MAISYKKARELIAGFSQTGGAIRDLSRIRALLSALGNKQDSLRFVHIAGTNGKGSVTTMLDAILTKAGYRCGKFTSPYIVDFCDRIQLCGENIPRDTLAALTEQVCTAAAPFLAQGMEFSQFEIIMAIAFAYFAQQSADIVCLEVGIGGGLDCTNVIAPPLCAVITSISRDHTALLGNSIAEIAAHKAGIIKGGCPVVSAPEQDADALAVIMEACATQGSVLHRPSLAAAQVHSADVSGSAFAYGNEHYRLGMAGGHQVINALTAIEVVHVLRKQGVAISQEAVRQGLACARIPARAEVIATQPLTILDGAHNPAGMKAALALLANAPPPRVVIIGMLADKLVRDTLLELADAVQAGLVDFVLCTEGYAAREIPAQKLAAQLILLGVKENQVQCVQVDDALSLAQTLAGESGTVLLAGSLYLASRIKNNTAHKNS